MLCFHKQDYKNQKFNKIEYFSDNLFFDELLGAFRKWAKLSRVVRRNY